MAHRSQTGNYGLANEAAACSYESMGGDKPVQGCDWKTDIAAAQHERRCKQKQFIQRTLLTLVSAALLGLLTFFGWQYYQPSRPCHHQHPTRLHPEHVYPVLMDHARAVDGLSNRLPSEIPMPGPPHMPSMPPYHPPNLQPLHCPAKIPFKGSGTFIIDPDKVKNMYMFVRATGSRADVVIERDRSDEDRRRAGHNNDDNDDDDDKHRDMIRIRANVFVDSSSYQERLRITEGRDKDDYKWSLEDTSAMRREHRSGCVRAFVHIRLPNKLKNMDTFKVGILDGSIGSKNLKGVRFDRFFAATTYGTMRLDELNTKSEALMETMAGQIMLNRAWSDVMTLRSMSGSIHVMNAKANKLMQMHTVGGSQYIDKVKASELRAHSLDNRIHLHEVMADVINVTTIRDDILADVDVARQFHACSMSGMVRAHVRCACKEREEEFRAVSGHGKWMPDVSVKTVSGQVLLTMAEGYEGRFMASSMTGWVEVHGKEVETRKGLHDPHFKYGWVRGRSGEDAPMVFGKSLTGSVTMNFE